MPSISCEGIILKRRNFGEADRMLTVLTDRLGKISIVAKGVRRITSRRAGNVELLNRVKLHLFKGKGFTLQEAESLDTFSQIKDNLTLATTAFHILELIDRLTVEEQKNQEVYQLTVEVLKQLEQNPRQIFVRAFEVKLLSLTGFWSSQAIKELDAQTENLLNDLETKSWMEIAQIHLKGEQAVALEKLLRYYIERIIESKLKSVRVLRKVTRHK